MAIDLTGVNAKLDRASVHWEDLHRSDRAGPLYPSVTLERRANGDLVEWTVSTMDCVSEQFGTTMGDCVHNYRCVLDHLVAEARRSVGFPDSKTSQWPIFDQTPRGGWEKASARNLDGVPDEVRAVIERSQPYLTDRPELQVLSVLNMLDNTDKHRRLNVVVTKSKTLSTVNLPRFNDGLVWNKEPLAVGVIVASHPAQPVYAGAQTTMDVIAEAAINEAESHWGVGELVWLFDKKVRQLVEQVAVALGHEGDVFTGSVGASGYPFAETNMLDPTGLLGDL